MTASFTDVESAKRLFDQGVERCLDYDQQEVRAGLAQTWAVDCPHRSQIDETAKAKEAELSEARKKLNDFYHERIESSRQILEEMSDKIVQWQAVASECTSIADQITHAAVVGEWSGPNADSYRAHADSQAKAVDDLKRFADFEWGACEKVRKFHLTAFTAIHNAFIASLAVLQQKGGFAPPRSVTKGAFDAHPNISYYPRTNVCIPVVQQLEQDLRTLTLGGNKPLRAELQIEERLEEVNRAVVKLTKQAPIWPSIDPTPLPRFTLPDGSKARQPYPDQG